MKKHFVTILCATLCTALLFGCGSKEEEQIEEAVVEIEEAVQPEEPIPEPEPVTEEPDDEIAEEEPEPETDDNFPLFKIDNPIIYDAEGVTVTLDEYNIDENNEYLNLTLSIVNQNPDNKKVYFRTHAFVDGGFSSTIESSELIAGESDTIAIHVLISEYFEFRELINAGSIPMESLTISYDIQIGSDSEYVYGQAEFTNSDFTEEDFKNVYGEKINEVELLIQNPAHDSDFATYKIEIYLKHTEDDYTLITAKEINTFDPRPLNLYGIQVQINNNQRLHYSVYSSLGSYAQNVPIIRQVFDTPNRAELEIPNDVAI